MKAVRVCKMSGAGNDFLLLGPDDAAAIDGDIADWVRRVCRRRLSVGADGVLLVEPVAPERVRVRFHNPDGSPAFCGNGSRCAARFAFLRGMTGRTPVLVTAAGDVPAEVRGDQVRLDLPPPTDAGPLDVEIGDETLRGRHVVAGTPHFVMLVADPLEAPLERWGPGVRHHPRFAPEGTNVDVMRIDGNEVTLRTWEKGVERETLACGSGAVAAAVAARARGAGDAVRVMPAGGIALEVELTSSGRVALSGDARIVFQGEVLPEALTGFRLD